MMLAMHYSIWESKSKLLANLWTRKVSVMKTLRPNPSAVSGQPRLAPGSEALAAGSDDRLADSARPRDPRGRVCELRQRTGASGPARVALAYSGGAQRISAPSHVNRYYPEPFRSMAIYCCAPSAPGLVL